MSFRVAKVASMFDVSLAERVRHEWEIDLPLEEAAWQLGVIVGPSGCGKTTIAQSLWPDAYTRGYAWDARSILDNFPDSLEAPEIVRCLTSVGFSSPPDWVKPYGVLSTGQQMRCDLARALAAEGLVVFDEFTSVVDRTVAKIGSAALARAVRKQPGRQFIAVTCHADVIEWLAPDWVYEPATSSFTRRCLRRPPITLDFHRVHKDAWRFFGQYHYLSNTLHGSAQCFLATWQGTPVGFTAVLPMVGFTNVWRESRTVILPDFQGVGIGTALSDWVANYYVSQGKRYRSTSSHPSFLAHRKASPHWVLVNSSPFGYPKHHGHIGKVSHQRTVSTSLGRAVTTFEYIGAADGNAC